MAKFIKGDVVVLNFPFSDLTGSKRRPALVLASLQGNDVLLCQITSQVSVDAIAITNADFTTGSLPVNSFIKPYKLFTADQNIFIKTAGHVNDNITNDVVKKIVGVLTL
jgi:mRNA interferase MazF